MEESVAAAREREEELRAAIGRAEGEEKRLATDRAEVATAKALAEEQKKAAEADRVGPASAWSVSRKSNYLTRKYPDELLIRQITYLRTQLT
jgi:alkylation response protein AidB-like acyl-CoA dehydrogenase